MITVNMDKAKDITKNVLGRNENLYWKHKIFCLCKHKNLVRIRLQLWQKSNDYEILLTKWIPALLQTN